jgi:hypothetical protein
MTRSAPREKVARLRLSLRVYPFRAPDSLDYEPKRHVYEVSIQMAAAYAARQRYFADLTQ